MASMEERKDELGKCETNTKDYGGDDEEFDRLFYEMIMQDQATAEMRFTEQVRSDPLMHDERMDMSVG